jgi:hypothetical protein
LAFSIVPFCQLWALSEAIRADGLWIYWTPLSQSDLDLDQFRQRWTAASRGRDGKRAFCVRLATGDNVAAFTAGIRLKRTIGPDFVRAWPRETCGKFATQFRSSVPLRAEFLDSQKVTASAPRQPNRPTRRA